MTQPTDPQQMESDPMPVDITSPSTHLRTTPPPQAAAVEEQVVDGQAPHVSIVLPCYNEEDHVLLEIERICAAMDASGYTYELLAVDDCSTDSTLARLREAEDT